MRELFLFDGIGFDVKLGLGVKIFDFLGGGGIKFEFWWAGKLIFWEGGGIKFEFCWGNCADWTVHLSD